MFSINNYDYDCTKKCKNIEHGKIITHAITKRSVSDEKLAAFIAKSCRNFTNVLDYEGRSALHLAASLNRYAIAEWLIILGANVNLKDKESAHTALHRALFYGNINIAVLLLRYGAIFDLPDENFKIPIQYCLNSSDSDNRHNELFAWGANKNYNLGIGNDQEKNSPENVTYFNKINIGVNVVNMSQYHSIFLTDENKVYSVGHGRGGRLGIGVESTLVMPKLVKVPTKKSDEFVIDISAAKNHSLLLTNLNTVYSSGLNDFGQLGHPLETDQLLTFKNCKLMKLNQFSDKKFSKIVAHDYYSLAHNEDTIIVWGFNGGQFGEREKINPVKPKQLSINDHKIVCLDSNEAAIVFYTATKNLFVFHKFKGKTYRSPGLEIIKKLSVSGGEFILNDHTSQANKSEPLRVVVLTEQNNIYIWYEDIQKYIKCQFPVIRYLPVKKIFWCNKKLLILSSDGDLYYGQPIKYNSQHIDVSEYQETYIRKDVCEISKIRIELKRVSHTSKVSNVFVDKDGDNLAILQENCIQNFKIPEYNNIVGNLENLLNESNESDKIHDLILVVDQQKFPVHKFVIYNRAHGLRNLIHKNQNKIFHLDIESMNAIIFQIILKCIYLNWIPDKNDILLIQCSSREFHQEKDAIKILKKFLIQFGLTSNAEKILKSHMEINSFPSFKRSQLPELYDVNVKCANNQLIKAHKCILVSRLEYFNMMFSHSWEKTNEINMSTIPIEFMEPIIDYLYSYDFKKLQTGKMSDSFLFTMITICDQYFIEQMKYNFEILITERLTIKNCGDILEFSSIYNCPSLEKISMEFVCRNLARILECHSLDNLDIETLNKINENYRVIFPQLDCRVITPYFDAIDDDLLESFIDDFHIDLEPKIQNDEIKLKTKINIKPSRLTLDRRHYEKQAINLVKDLSLEDSFKNNTRSYQDSNSITDDKIEIDVKSWNKVPIKKEVKKKIVAGLKVNEILKTETKGNSTFVNLNAKSPQSPKNNGECEYDVVITPSKTSMINFGDFTPIKNGKLSQKQRKRLSSETMINASPCSSSSIEINNSVESPPVVESVWGRVHQTEPIDILSTNKTRYRQQSSSSFSDIVSPNSLSSPPATKDFFEIIADEKKQKQCYERTKHKSLILTQIEEEAIEDLKKFYNVDNVFDETITISRKSEITFNFAVWDHQNQK